MNETKTPSASRWKTLRDAARKANRFSVLGAVVTLFAVIGLIVTLVAAGRLVVRVATNESQVEFFEDKIAPLVMLDPAPVEEVEKLGDKTIVSAAIWDIVLHTNPSDYASDDFSIYVPASDVESHVKQLFGEVEYRNTSVLDAAYIFEYSAENKIYTVPKELQFFSYRPSVEEISHTGDHYSLRVGYQPQGSAWGQALSHPDRETTFKYVIYDLVREDGEYHITAIRQPEETSSLPASSSSVQEESTPESSSETTESSESSSETSSNGITRETNGNDSSSTSEAVEHPEG